MTAKKYFDDYTGCEITVEEMSRKEATEYTIDFIDGLETACRAGFDPDIYVYVEYKDGSYYYNSCGDTCGKFKKTNIKAVVLDDSSEYYIFGKYKMNENTIPEII